MPTKTSDLWDDIGGLVKGEGQVVGMDIGTQSDAIERLASTLTEEKDRRVVWVTGSGVSVPLMPSTLEMCELFAQKLGETLNSPPVNPAEEYRRLAKALKLRRGPGVARRLVEEQVARACAGSGDTQVPNHTHESWQTTPQVEAIASLIHGLPEQQRGPIITTNFDPLLEVALHRRGVPCQPMSAGSLGGINMTAGLSQLPVVHIHGLWSDAFPLNTDAELDLERPVLEEQLSAVLENAIVIAVGYGGWEDSFSRTITKFAQSNRLSLSNTELLWMHHGPPTGGALVSELRGSAIFVEYEHVDLGSLARTVARVIVESARPKIPNALGVSRIEVPTNTPERAAMERMVLGSRPDLSVSAHAPQLSASVDLRLAAEAVCDQDSVVAAVGPTGEGKSVALLQASCDLQKSIGDGERCVVTLDAGAVVPRTETVSSFRERFRHTYIVLDEADLLFDALVDRLRETAGHGSGTVTLLVAMHSQYMHKLTWKKKTASERWAIVSFNGPSESDLGALADYWLENQLLSPGYANATPSQVVDVLRDGVRAVDGTSLFGAMLHLWDGEELRDRVSDLLVRLDRMTLGEISFRRILEAIALVHWAWNENGVDEYSEGMPESAIGALVRVSSPDVFRIVVKPLGREAALSRVGVDVFVRHPAIAQTIVDLMSDDDFVELARELGAVGGRMRASGERGSRVLTQLCKHLEGRAALAAAEGAVRGSGLVETRVTFMSVLRRNGKSKLADKLATVWEKHLDEFEDTYESARGFYVEWSVNAMVNGEYRSAVGFAFKSLTDSVQGRLTVEQVRYSIANLHNAARGLGRLNAGGKLLVHDCLDILSVLPDGASALPQVASHGRSERRVHALTANLRNHALAVVPNKYLGALGGLLVLLSRHDIRQEPGPA